MEEEEEVFEIIDFTSASEWEVFTSKLEEILLSWQLSLKDQEETSRPLVQKEKWISSFEDITFAGYPFTVTHYWMEEESSDQNVIQATNQTGSSFSECLMNSKNDFPNNCHFLSYCYGLEEFVVISPSGNEALTSESRINLVLSSMTMAVNNIHCRAPLFVQVHRKWQQLYLGVYESKNYRTDFEMVHLKRGPMNCKHLAGLINLFKEKIGSSSCDRVGISVRWKHVLSDRFDIDSEDWPQPPPDLEILQGDVGVSSLGKLGFGTTKDPIKEISVAAVWSSLNEDVVVDSEVYTDLDPLQAPLWTIHLELNDAVPSLLIKSLTSFLDSCNSTETMEQLLGKIYTVLNSPDSPEYSAALGPLTSKGSYPLVGPRSSLLHWGSSSKKSNEGPIPEKMVITLLNYLFPDAEGDEPKNPYPETFGSDCPSIFDHSWKESLGLKTAPVDSLVWRLAIVMVYTNMYLKSTKGIAHLWHEIVLELRFRLENGYSIPGLEKGLPDLNSCRLYQKLQMLNCCIDHRQTRSSMTNPVAEEEEFFDALEDMDTSENVPKYSAWNQPQGRKEKSKLKLIQTGEPLYIPITQEPLPMTEDMLEEQAELLAQLGTDATGSELRARILSASLFSDMEAFKAANPGAVMEDFVRWHSPRDWIEEDMTSEGCKVEGHLSSRMQGPRNLWQEMWHSAKPVVAWRQKRLFDDTKEAEKILHLLSSLTPGQICLWLLPVVFHIAILRLVEELVPQLTEVEKNARLLFTRLSQIVTHNATDIEQYEDLLPLLQKGEVRLSQFRSLRKRMNDGSWKDLDEFVTKLLISKHVHLPGGLHTPTGAVLLKAFEQTSTDAILKLPTPSKKEYILRTTANRPGKGSGRSPQKMYCSIENDSFRLAGAFTQDTMFY